MHVKMVTKLHTDAQQVLHKHKAVGLFLMQAQLPAPNTQAGLEQCVQCIWRTMQLFVQQASYFYGCQTDLALSVTRVAVSHAAAFTTRDQKLSNLATNATAEHARFTFIAACYSLSPFARPVTL